MVCFMTAWNLHGPGLCNPYSKQASCTHVPTIKKMSAKAHDTAACPVCPQIK
jgi:hypothetical protein